MKAAASIVLGLLLLVSPLLLTRALAAEDAAPTGAELDAKAAQARRRVIEIINQPITHLARTDQAAMFSPGWFHDGAVKPDFNTVDIRATQEFPYEHDAYVTSDLNPSEMFRGAELEFNSMTKYFYIDRTLPKKRLSEAEMLEINSLYRVIGRDEQSLAQRWQLTGAVGLASLLAISLLVVFRQALSRGVEAVLGRRDSPAGAGRTAPR